MEVDQDESLRTSLKRALFLSERMEAPTNGNQVEDGILEEWMERWKEACGGHDRFEKRLEWSNTSPGDVKDSLRQTPSARDSIDELCADVTHLLNSLTDDSLPELPPGVFGASYDEEISRPFPDAYEPFLRRYRADLLEELNERGIDVLNQFHEKARAKLVRGLFLRLSRIGSDLLFEEFDRRRPAGDRMLLNITGGSGDSRDEYYEPFVRDLLTGGWEELFVEYPVMARLFVTVADFWKNAAVEFLRRLERDGTELADVFFDENRPPDVVDLDVNCSDPHYEGRSVVVVHFEDDRDLVYKPKPVGMEATFSRFIEWLNQFLDEPLYDHNLLPREDYGWIEYISQDPCESEKDVEDYYFRAGELLSVLYTFSATDLHNENLVAHGAQPVVIDYESLFHGRNHWFDPESAPEENSVRERFRRSVTRTAMLPRWITRGPDRRAVEIGGLSGPAKDHEYVRTGWKNLNTDDMIRKKKRFSPPPDNNLVMFEDEHRPVTEYRESLIEGFTQGYRTLLDRRESLLEDWLPAFRDRILRFIFRNTRAYFSLLNDSLTPDFLRDGVRFEINLEKLLAGFLGEDEKPPAWVLHRAELDQLKHLDVPLFGATAEKTELSEGVDQPVPNFLAESGLEHSRRTIENMDEADCDFQVRIIRGCLKSLGVNRGNQGDDPTEPNGERRTDETEIDFMEEAKRIRRRILGQVIEDPDGSPQWLTTVLDAEGDRARFRPVDDSLYGGKAGIALFLAADDYVRGVEENRDCVETILEPHFGRIRRWLDRDGSEKIPYGMGGFNGFGSNLYLLTQLGTFYRNDEYYTLALELCQNLTPDRIRRDDTYDLMAGTAGTLRALLSLYEVTESPELLETARLCGDHLRDNQEDMGEGSGAWDTIGQFPVTGLGHGASGIMLALERLYQATDEDSYRESVRRALAFERDVYREEPKNWPDYRRYNPFKDSDEEIPYMVTWCAGAPGIALSRLKLMRTMDDEVFSDEIEAGIETTLEDGSRWAFDHYCCGDMARFEIVRRAQAESMAAANGFDPEQALRSMISRARGEGGYRLLGEFDRKYQPPGLMTGLAGIGYGLLYWNHEEVLPDVLVLE